MKTFLAVAVSAGFVVGMALSQTSPPLPGLSSEPPPPVSVRTAVTEQFDRMTIEQLIEQITNLKTQRQNLEKLEAKAVNVLKQKLRDANERAAQFEGWQERESPKADVKKG